MFKYILLFIGLNIFLTSCNKNVDKTAFTHEALEENVEHIDGSETTIDQIISENKGENLIIDIWASWCADCIKSLPKVAKFQKEHPEVQFVFISVDDEKSQWKNGVTRFMDKFDVKGKQYHFPTGWDRKAGNEFIDFVGLDWIPRFMLIGEKGTIEVFYAKSIEDKNIEESL